MKTVEEKRAYMNKYMTDYRKKKPEKWNKNNICEVCGGKYQNSGKTNHLITTKHQYKLLKNKNDVLENNQKTVEEKIVETLKTLGIIKEMKK